MYYYYYVYVFLYVYILVFLLTNMLCAVYFLPTGILRLPWVRIFRSFSTVAWQMPGYTRYDQKVPRLIFLLGCGYTSGHPCLQRGILELPLSLGQGMVPAHLSFLCDFRSKRVVHLRLVIVSAAEGMALVCGNKHAAGSRVRWKLYGANHHGRRDVGLRVWPKDETSVFAVEVCWFPETKESAPSELKSESHAHCFLWYGGHCSFHKAKL